MIRYRPTGIFISMRNANTHINNHMLSIFVIILHAGAKPKDTKPEAGLLNIRPYSRIEVHKIKTKLDFETRKGIFCIVMLVLIALAVVAAGCPPNVQEEYRSLLHLGIGGLAPLCMKVLFSDSDLF